MRLIVEIEQETDGRWLAEIVDLPREWSLPTC